MLAFIIVNYNNYQETIKAVNSLYEIQFFDKIKRGLVYPYEFALKYNEKDSRFKEMKVKNCIM